MRIFVSTSKRLIYLTAVHQQCAVRMLSSSLHLFWWTRIALYKWLYYIVHTSLWLLLSIWFLSLVLTLKLLVGSMKFDLISISQISALNFWPFTFGLNLTDRTIHFPSCIQYSNQTSVSWHGLGFSWNVSIWWNKWNTCYLNHWIKFVKMKWLQIRRLIWDNRRLKSNDKWLIFNKTDLFSGR